MTARAWGIVTAAYLLLAIVAFPSVAEARWTATGERDASSNPVAARTAMFARDWLGRRGHHACQTELLMAPSLQAPGDRDMMLGRAWRCTVWVLEDNVRRANSRKPVEVFHLCMTMVHEFAHTAGVHHDDPSADDPLVNGKRMWTLELAADDGCDRFARRLRREV